MAPRVFVDGHQGTTGLRIRELLADRGDLECLEIPADLRKDEAARREHLNAADLVIFCLPDDAARQAVSWIDNPSTRVIDASTAHRVDPDWVFGLQELEPGQRAAIAESKRVTNPGCYSTAFVLALRPLVDAGLVPADAPLSVHALSGYSGGGRSMIERWQDPATGLLGLPHEAPYALDTLHKHLPEMAHYARIARPPHFVPAVGPFRCGMRVEIPLPVGLLADGATGKAIWETLHLRYAGERFASVAPLREPLEPDERSFDPQEFSGTNRLEIAVVPNPAGHVLLIVRLDNLGKGAAGMAVQSLNLMLGLPEETGLR
jgi:N-acetyl-gamma-glutamyl-phosphate reductase